MLITALLTSTDWYSGKIEVAETSSGGRDTGSPRQTQLSNKLLRIWQKRITFPPTASQQMNAFVQEPHTYRGRVAFVS